MENSNYYMDEKIGSTGVAPTRNPIYMTEEYNPFETSGRKRNVGDIVTPTSKYDETLGNLDSVIYGETTVDDLRARQQSLGAKLGNALVNNAVIAGTTAVSGTLGFVEGLFSAAGEGDISKLWDNNINNWAADVQRATSEAFPIYRGQEYANKSNFEKLFTGIFWADFIQNLGFTEGMLLSGAGMAKLLSSAPTIVRGLVPSLSASIGEASTEAINSKRDEMDYKTRVANDDYNQKVLAAKSPFAISLLDTEYRDTLNDIEHDANVAGNFVFGSNVALLTMSNALQFGRLFSRGYGTAKKVKGALKRKGKTYALPSMTTAMLGTGAKRLGEGLTEAGEEIAQGVISSTPSNYADYNTFNESMFNPEKRELVSSIWQAMGTSFSEAMGDKETGVEFLMGFFTSVLGVPVLKKSKFPLRLENNAFADMYNTYKETRKRQELANTINERLQDDQKIKAYYNGLARHLTIQDRMNTALDAEDMFDYKTAESAQFISDMMMFDEAGDIQHLKEIINNSIDMSDEGIDSIIKETSSDGEGPFMSNGNPLDRDEVRRILKEKVDVLNSKLDNYVKDKEGFESAYPNMDNETLSNALFLKSQFRDHQLRYTNLLDKTYAGVRNLIQSIPQEKRNLDKIKKGEGIFIKDETGKRKLVRKEDIDYFDEEGNPVFKEQFKEQVENPSFISALTKDSFIAGLHQSPIFNMLIDSMIENNDSSMPYDERQALKTDIKDLLQLEESLVAINKSLKDILVDSTKSTKDLEKTKQDAVNKETKQKTADLKSKLSSSTSLIDFRKTLNEEQDETVKAETLKALEEEGNELAKNYKEVEQYNNEVQKAINNFSDVSSEAKSDALKLLQDQYSNSSKLDEIANPKSIYIDNADALYDESLSPEENMRKFQEGQYALLRAMNKVNNDNKFKDRFSAEYKTLEKKGKPVPNAPEKETTGDSETATIPAVDDSVEPPVTYTPAAGDISESQVLEENGELNEKTETPESEDNKQGGRKLYYRPAIPQLHIEGSKEGDFRPFNEVVKEREKGVNFDVLYKYLKDAGAFDYVNEGKLAPNAEIGFMIDPELEEKMKVYSWYKGPTILLIDKKNNQVVGSLDAAPHISDRFEGLSQLEERIVKEWENRQNSVPNISEAVYRLSEATPIKETVLERKEQVERIFKSDADAKKILINVAAIKAETVEGLTDEEAAMLLRNYLYDTPIPRKGEYNKNSKIQKPSYFNSITEQLKDKKSNWEYYRDDTNRVYSGIEYVTGVMYQSTLEPAINFAIDSGVLPKKYKKYLGKTRENAIEKEDLQEIIDEFKKLGINNPSELLSYVSQNSNELNKFIATPTTRVSKIMVGKIPYSKDSKSLADIPNISTDGKNPILGIVKRRSIATNGIIDEGDIMPLFNVEEKEGRLYLLIPNAAGKYSPAAVRVKHFNKEEFNPEDVNVQNTPIFKKIQKAIQAFSKASNEEKVSNAVSELSKWIYTGDLHINWFSSDKGNGIRFTKVQRDANGNEIYEVKNGQRRRKEVSKVVFFQEKSGEDTLLVSFTSGDTSTRATPSEPSIKSTEAINKEIENILLNFDLPIQVDLYRLNTVEYNNTLINSGVLTSNISDARVIGNWFTTDYLDSEGKVQKAVNPASRVPKPGKKVETPVGGSEGAIRGTKITIGGTPYIVDLSTGVIYNDNGQRIRVKGGQLVVDLAWAQANFGNSTNGSIMWDNKVLLPNGKVLDRTSQKYLEGKEAQEVIDRIKGKPVNKPTDKTQQANAKKVLGQIAENQKRVDKTRTDSDYYHVQEEDGEYHAYDRVHSRLGNNWIESKKQTAALKDIGIKLAKQADDVRSFNNYLTSLENYWKVDLSAFRDKVDVQNRNAIINAIRNNRALDAGSAVDGVVRQFFTSNEMPTKPNNMTERAFSDLITTLTEIRSNIEARGERFLANNIVLFHKYPDGTRIAGEVDILSVDANGNFRIYDVKTSKYSFHDFEQNGRVVNYFNNASSFQKMSSRDYYTLQLSAYKNLFESQYKTPIKSLAILPFVLNYDKNTVTGVNKEKGIIIKYNPSVNVPLSGAVSPSSTSKSSTPVFDSVFETMNPVNNVLPETSMKDSTVGYFVKDSKIHKSYLVPVGKIGGIDTYMTKVVNMTKGMKKNGPSVVGTVEYHVVFPNGNSMKLITSEPQAMTDEEAKNTMYKQLSGNPSRVISMANEKTIMYDPSDKPLEPSTPTVETPANVLATPSSVSEEATSLSKTQAIQDANDEFDDDDITKFRKVDEDRKIWNQEKELAWLAKVLPQLEPDAREHVVKGLIEVNAKGDRAWGQFNNGIITLSDIAAEGTTYHEAFHAVFNLLLDPEEREALFKEAREMYGNKDNLSLEEDMAEGFREYVQSRQTKNIGKKILNFFKDLWIKVTNWNKVRPHLLAYYQMINEGKYADRTSLERTSETLLKEEVQRFFDNFDITIKEVEEFNSTEPLFDAINRVINIRNAEDISEGTGYAIVYMMQHNPLITDLIKLHEKGRHLQAAEEELRKTSDLKIKLNKEEWKAVDRDNALREIGKDIAVELRKLYNLEKPTDTSNSYIRKIWKVITEFFSKITPATKTKLEVIQKNTRFIATAVKLNDISIIRYTPNKPDTEGPSIRVDIESALRENPYEDSIIRALQKYGISLGGSASVALEGTLYRPVENPLHDIDFNAVDYTKEQLDDIISREFPYSSHIRTIIEKGKGEKSTETYLVLDREFRIEQPTGMAAYTIVDAKTGERLGSFVQSNLVLKEGVQGKFLDFFMGKDNRPFPNKKIILNNREYLISDYRNAFTAKVEWARLKDIWDYNRLISNKKVPKIEALKRERDEYIREKMKSARVIWAHPAIGKTTYLESNNDILEWDDIVNKRKNAFLRSKIDPEHKMDIESLDYKRKRSKYLAEWRNHPDYIQFLTTEWTNLLERAKRENKRVFTSVLPLLEIGRNDIDLIVALNYRDFKERNMQRGGGEYQSIGWKQNIDEELLTQDPSKIVYTDKYFSEFMREYLGVQWGTLTSEERDILTKKGWTSEKFDSVSQAERDKAIECIAF